jgi:predicted transcriptional regulator
MLVKGGVKMKTNEVVRVSYYTDAKTRRRLKLLAAKTDRSITEIVDEAVKTYLDKHAVIFQED